MAFKKGQAKVPGSGIKKGGSWRGKPVRDIVEEMLNCSLPERVMQLCRNINDERLELDVMLDLMPYCYPKYQAVELQAQATIDVNNENVQALVILLEKMNADQSRTS